MAPGKEALYGSLDPTTLEWTDGIFTKVLREVRAPIRLYCSRSARLFARFQIRQDEIRHIPTPMFFETLAHVEQITIHLPIHVPGIYYGGP